MKILLTGGHGMVGQNFRHRAKESLHSVWAPSRSELDLRDKMSVRRQLSDFRPDIVVHAAGRVGGIAANLADPYAFLLENIEIGTNVIEAAVDAGIPRLLNLGSSCMYPKDVDGELHEDMILTGQLEPSNEGYALAKVVALRLCEFASRQHVQLNYKTLIPCNLFGRYDNFDPMSAHLIPAIVRKVHSAKMAGSPTVEIWGDGSARREFMYSGDLAEAMLLAIDRFDQLPALMNIGVGQDHSVLEYYRAVAEAVGWSGEFVFDLTKPTGMRRKLLSVERQTEWGWGPSTSLQAGILSTYEYFLSEVEKDK